MSATNWKHVAARAAVHKASALRHLVAAGVICCSVATAGAPARADGVSQTTPARKSAAPAAPSKLLGQWEVKRVLLDVKDQGRWGLLRPGSPTLLYRGMIIAADKITFADQQASCSQSSWQPLVTTWRGLFEATSMARVGDEGSTLATPADYDLKVPEKQRVQAYPLCPRSAPTTPESWQGAHWMVLHGQELVVRYGNQLILVLRKRPASEKPQASFSCAQAASPTEKAICGHHELAGLDRSMSEALRLSLERRDAKERERIQKEQVAWRSERDRCGMERACIQKAYDQRMMQLIQD